MTPSALLERAATPPAAAPAIELLGVTKRFGSVDAVRGIDLRVAPGEVVALLGPNGAGKSTTVGMLLGLTSPDAGEVRVCGRTPREAVAAGRIAAMMQDAGLMPGVRVAELLGLARRMYPDPLPVDRALAASGLADLATRRVDKLSGGQAQRLRFAMVAVANPEVLLLDEPTTALDVAGRQEFWAAMRGYAAGGRTVVFATHYLDEVDGNASRVVVVVGGRIVADGTPAEVRAVAGGTVVTFTCDRYADLPALAAVTSAERDADRVTLRTADADATVRDLARSGLDWRDLRVTAASLDDSFLLLTRDADGGSR